MWTASFFLNRALLGVGLAMDAFSVSTVSGLTEPNMKKRRAVLIAGVFGGFQFLMPFLGWILVSFAETLFSALRGVVPWIAFALLVFLGVKMLIEGFRKERPEGAVTGFGALLLQGIATSIDALSAGLATAEDVWIQSLVSSALIGGITFVLCLAAIWIGKRFGEKLQNKAMILGGIIL
ncbi:MAG: manganese efflux pump, partial [Lachnospiraceae bacterium]|nr:manganese efflux pump [Lachnospiraceae bacterium]